MYLIYLAESKDNEIGVVNMTINNLKKIAKELENSYGFKTITRHYPVRICIDDDRLIIFISLIDKQRKLTDVITIETDSNGLVHPGEAIYYIAIAFNMGLIAEEWKQIGKRFRLKKYDKMKGW